MNMPGGDDILSRWRLNDSVRLGGGPNHFLGRRLESSSRDPRRIKGSLTRGL